MAEHRVGELRLHLHATSSSRADLRGAAEHFIACVLEAAGDRLESKWPGRLVFLRDLPLHCSVTEDELSDATAISRYADEIVASIDTATPQQPGQPLAGQNVVVFRDETQWWACYLSARAAGDGEERAWVYEALRAKGIGFASLAGRERRFAIAVLRELADSGTLLRVVSVVEPQAVESVCGSLGISVPAAGLEPGVGRPIGHPAQSRLSGLARALPGSLPLRALALVLYVEAVEVVGASAPPEEVAALVSLVLEELAAERRVLPVAGSRQREPLSPIQEPPPVPTVWETRFGGLFYLLTLALELEIGEMLWKACLPEGAFLAHCAAALLGPAAENDPAPLLYGGVLSLDACPPEVTAPQQEEVATALVGSLAAALPRRSLAGLPQVVLCLAPGATTQMLVASERGSAFAVFVWPVSGARDVETGLRTFLARWPASAPPVLGTPSIAEVDGHQRVRPVSGLTPPPQLFLPRTGSAWTSALMAQIVGALCYLFVARAGVERPAEANAFVERHLAIPARIDLSPQEMTINIPMSRVDISRRRSGLDRDPGWVPWLGRTVRFVFEALP